MTRAGRARCLALPLLGVAGCEPIKYSERLSFDCTPGISDEESCLAALGPHAFTWSHCGGLVRGAGVSRRLAAPDDHESIETDAFVSFEGGVVGGLMGASDVTRDRTVGAQMLGSGTCDHGAPPSKEALLACTPGSPADACVEALGLGAYEIVSPRPWAMRSFVIPDFGERIGEEYFSSFHVSMAGPIVNGALFAVGGESELVVEEGRVDTLVRLGDGSIDLAQLRDRLDRVFGRRHATYHNRSGSGFNGWWASGDLPPETCWPASTDEYPCAHSWVSRRRGRPDIGNINFGLGGGDLYRMFVEHLFEASATRLP